jgi:hypothetical protein
MRGGNVAARYGIRESSVSRDTNESVSSFSIRWIFQPALCGFSFSRLVRVFFFAPCAGFLFRASRGFFFFRAVCFFMFDDGMSSLNVRIFGDEK